MFVTVSGGATLVHPGETPQKALERAEALLYESKSTGRNRITFG
jgi:PleD family two-component response regulator